MKNLKRVLSLGLASVMLLGMMVMGASAKDFTDAEEIVHDEAVQILVALGVINGKEDGSFFDPKGDVTRAEMAKMIAVIKTGGNAGATGVKTTPSFTDIGGHWAEAQIEYCADMGIVSGRGDGTFDPNGKVTGTEVTKMVLTALGYESKAYKLEGATWAAQTDELARQASPKLWAELDSKTVINAPATRDDAAMILWNGLQNETRTVNPEKNTNNSEVTWGYTTSGKTLLEERFDAKVMTGTYNGNYNYNAGSALKGEIRVDNEHFPSDMSIDNLGEEVKVIWKDGAKGTAGKPDAKDTILGVFNTGATRVVKSQLSKIKDAKDGKAELNIDGVKYETLNTVDYVVNYTASVGKAAVKAGDNSDLTKALKKNSGYPIKVVFDDNGKVKAVYVTESYLGVVTANNGTNITIAGATPCNLKIADHDVEEGLERGDIVALTPLYDTDPSEDDSVVTVKKAEKVSGELTGGKAEETLNVNGKSYKINYKNSDAKYGLLRTSVTIPGEKGTTVQTFPFSDNTNIGKDFDLYLVNGYVMAAIRTTDSASNYSLITEVKITSTAGSVFGGLQLQVMSADGTKEIISVSKDSSETAGVGTHDNDGTIDTDDYMVGDIITYTFDKNDMADVVVEAKVNASGTIVYGDKAKTVKVGAGTATVTASDCVFFAQTEAGIAIDDSKKVAENAEYEAYDIRELDGDTWTGAYSVAYDANGRIVAVFMNVQGTPNGATDETVYGIITSYDGREKDYWVYTVASNGEEYTVKSKAAVGNSAGQLNKGHLVRFNPTSDGTYAAGKVIVVNRDALPAGLTYQTFNAKEYNAKDNTLTVYADPSALIAPDGSDASYRYPDGADTTTYAIDKDAKIVYVDQDGDKSVGEGSISEFNPITGKKNVSIITKVVDGADVIQALFVETSGKKDVDNRG